MPDTTLPTPASRPSRSATGSEIDTVNVLRCDGYVVVSWFRDPRSVAPPYTGSYEYDHFNTLNDAADRYSDYANGEWDGYREIGIFPVVNGMPFGPSLDPVTLERLMQETREAA